MINIAIDGPSAVGKSTIAKLLAKELHYKHLDTGAMYRCVGLQAKRKGISDQDEKALVKMLNEIEIAFDAQGKVYINNEDVSKAIRENDISMLASNVSTHALVRAKLVGLQQSIAIDKGYIMDGRDIGTVVLKDAECKIFMIASVSARADRRFKEYVEKGINAIYQEIYDDIEKRDYQDSHRANSPLKKADDAIEIDTSNLSIVEVLDVIHSHLSIK